MCSLFTFWPILVISGSSRRSRNLHKRTGSGIVAPVEENCHRDRDGRVQGCRQGWPGYGGRLRGLRIPPMAGRRLRMLSATLYRS